MSLAVPPKAMTAEQIIALPDDGVHREIIRGQLRERPTGPHTRAHSETQSNIVFLLISWRVRNGASGLVHSGGAGFRLRRSPETFVGIDVAYASPELIASTNPNCPFYEGPPVLAVEILSPSDRHEDVVEKVGLYLEVGTVVWVVDPDFRTVTVHQPGLEIVAYHTGQGLSGDPYLPGFRVRVAQLFA
jgi:Uma2 family endonuclease